MRNGNEDGNDKTPLLLLYQNLATEKQVEGVIQFAGVGGAEHQRASIPDAGEPPLLDIEGNEVDRGTLRLGTSMDRRRHGLR